MFSFKKLKLRHQLAIFVSVSVFILISFEIFYFYRFYILTEERANGYIQSMLDQINEELNSITRDVQDIAYTVSYSKNTQEFFYANDLQRRLELTVGISDLLDYIKSTNKDITDVIILDSRNTAIYSAFSDYNFRISELEKQYDFANGSFRHPVFAATMKGPTDKLYFSYIFPIYSIVNAAGIGKRVGTCVVTYNLDDVQGIIERMSSTKNSVFMIVDSNNMVLASNERSLRGSTYTGTSLREESAGKIYTINNQYLDKHSIVQYKSFKITDWKIVNIMPIGELTSDMKTMTTFGITTGIILLLILISISIVISKSITGPVGLLISFTNSISGKSIKHRLEIPFENEIGILAKYINRMLDEIEATTRRIFTTQEALYEVEIAKNKAELAQKHAELSSLQNQINPHFLYNTLECIRSYAVINDVLEIEQITTSLAKIFRYSIKGDNIVTISEEINCIKDYINIMNIRFAGKLSLLIQMEDGMLSERIVKMILQPIVENAVYHGLEYKDGPGIIAIKGFLDEDGLITIQISDDGVGIKEEKLSQINALFTGSPDRRQQYESDGTRSIGLLNIDERLKLMYGTQYGLRIESSIDTGTTVYISYPSQARIL